MHPQLKKYILLISQIVYIIKVSLLYSIIHNLEFFSVHEVFVTFNLKHLNILKFLNKKPRKHAWMMFANKFRNSRF